TQMSVAYNRLGHAVEAQEVDTGAGTYVVSLLEGETRMRGVATVAVGGVLTVAGEVFVESRTGVGQTLSDGRSVQTDQLTLGGAGLSAVVTAGAGGADLARLGQADLVLVVSTNRANTNERWLTVEGGLHSASVLGYALDEHLQSAQLHINQALDAGGSLLDGAAAIDWSGQARTVALSAVEQGKQAVLDLARSDFSIPVSGALQLGESLLSGDFVLTLGHDSSGARTWDVTASNASVVLGAGGAQVSLTQASGHLFLSPTARSGSLTGRASLSGVGGVGLSGTLSASFSGTALVLSGTGVALSVDGFGEMTGDFAVQRSGTGASGVLQVGLSNVNASIGNADAGLGVSGASLGLLIKQRSDGATGYALVASGAASLHGFAGVSLEAAAEVRINTLGEASTASIAVGGGQVRLDFSDATERKEVRITAGTVAVDGLGSLSGALAVHSQTTLDASGVRVTDLQIGLAQINGSLNLGGLGATLGQGRGAVLLHREGTQAGTVAVQAQGDVALTGLGSALSLTVTQMSVAYNRLGHAVEAQEVDTGAGTYVVSLLEGETRMRGVATVVVGGVLTMGGQISIENRSNVPLVLSDNSTVQVDELVLAGLDLETSLTAGAGGLGLSLHQADVALVLATDRSDATHRWLTATADVGRIEVAGMNLAELTGARLSLNGTLSGGGLLVTPGAVSANWATPLAVSLGSGQVLDLSATGAELALSATGTLHLGPASAQGSFAITRLADGWNVRANDVQVVLAAGGARAILRHGTGDLYFGPGQVRSGFLTGQGAVEGVSGVSFAGQMQARFNSSTGNFELAGAAAIGLDGFASLSGQFAVTQVAPPVVVPQVVVVRADTAAQGQVVESIPGGVHTDAVFTLTSNEAGRFREGAYVFSHGGVSVTIDSRADDGFTPVSDAVFSQRLRAGLGLLFGSGNVAVSGDRASGLRIAMTGALSGQTVTDLGMTPPADPADKTDWGLVSQVQRPTQASPQSHYLLLEQQDSSISGAKFSFTAGSQTTAAIRYAADKNLQAVNIRQAIESLSGVGQGNVSVVFDNGTGGVLVQGYTITFAAGVRLPGLQVNAFTTAMDGSLMRGVVRVDATLQTLTGAQVATGTVQQVDLYDAHLQGGFTLAFTDQGVTYQTSEIAFNATAAQLRDALRAAVGNGQRFAAQGGDVQAELVGGADHQVWRVTFGGVTLGRLIPTMDGVVVSVQHAPQTVLAQIRQGAVSSEIQQLSVPAGTAAFALAFGADTTAPLATAVSASALQQALESLAGIGAGNVRVSAAAAGHWDIAFVGRLAGEDIQALHFTEVQTLDLRLADGRLADTASLRLAGGSTWLTTLTAVQGLTQADLRTQLETSLRALPGIGEDNLTVYVTATPGVFRLVGTGAFAGADLPTVVAGLSRDVVQPPSYLLIGAADVTARLGDNNAGLSVDGLGLGLVLSTNTTTGATGYALMGSGTASLAGFGG
ncbi:beta strand repeat-containing protein, partial [Sphaerotilus sp.]|uniref:beta strand repeat-containing protein n=1 Tax=Sphaerotilus sp. TaxID=2093942 RepID=UPI0034E259F4